MQFELIRPPILISRSTAGAFFVSTPGKGTFAASRIYVIADLALPFLLLFSSIGVIFRLGEY